MRTTLNISDDILKEVEEIYNKKNKSKAVEEALKDAIRNKRMSALKSLKKKIDFEVEPEDIEKMRSLGDGTPE
ncbi:hypothetical protein TSYNTROOL_10000 [Tepidanaerobacter syntrophicus]|uniref:type II toxin-antitoxin system VapB family antitoxin n=1 Tax=Tepidanaerobacter syntrophicus TaxID=224999 RepID=UPI001BD2173E|nr:type II toxin-antitoxin system VapB family antitoxin [Tepidanaerobacter syntrophicus]GLI50914.1 hypothetical protein TSYNTROOL_10000 [Tepidanaerobacter syntrophicus]